MTVLPATKVRSEFSSTVNRVAFGGERIIIESHGKNRAALVSLADLALIERIENETDIAKANKSMKEGGRTSLGDVEKQLGLSGRRP
jgi:prevent-host-death family protein